jgi:hypothetical protein
LTTQSWQRFFRKRLISSIAAFNQGTQIINDYFLNLTLDVAVTDPDELVLGSLVPRQHVVDLGVDSHSFTTCDTPYG